jgi:hypothetical protein
MKTASKKKLYDVEGGDAALGELLYSEKNYCLLFYLFLFIWYEVIFEKSNEVNVHIIII